MKCSHDRVKPWKPMGSRYWYCWDCGRKVPDPAKQSKASPVEGGRDGR